VNATGERPDPDKLLEHVQAEEEKASRGRLKIFFGASAGVGKTYTMLEDARKARAVGRDVVVGYVEPHGRKETEALLTGLEQVPPRTVEYHGVSLREFDVDAALARRPGIILVDELAHTNAPGSRHAKRWQDVEDLLAAGIDVHTTLNVQHLESLNDIVAQITGVVVRETLPDAVFERADEVELVDLTPDDLLERLRQGKVYLPALVERAVQSFFRKSNLIALRELALRKTADRVNADVLTAHGLQPELGPWPTRERVLICVGPSPNSRRVIRAGRRLAAALRADLVAATVDTAFTRRQPPAAREQLAQNLALAERLGAETVTLSGQVAADELLSYARSHNMTKIVVGAPSRPAWLRLFLGSTAEALIKASGEVDVHVVGGGEADDEAEAEAGEARRARGAAGESTPPAAWRHTALVVLGCSLVAAIMAMAGLSEANLIMVYLLGVAWVAARWGRVPAAAASVLSVLLFDFFFVPPALTFAVSDTQYLVTFAIMLGIALLIGTLTARIREQGEGSRERERRMEALYQMSRHLSGTTGTITLVYVALQQLAKAFGTDVVILLPDREGKLSPPPGVQPNFLQRDIESGVARWVFERGQPAGNGTDTLPGSAALYLPLVGSSGPVGVLGLRPPEHVRLAAPEQRQLLATMANQIAVALERDFLAQTAQDVRVAAEAERLRSSLLASVSHDLRTPLAVISGASGALLDDGAVQDPAARRQMLASIHAEADRLARLVRNLLDMTRVESGTLEPEREWHPLEEIVGSALQLVSGRLGGASVTTALPPDLPLLHVDGLLVGQVLINLIDNVLQHAPPGTPIDISARHEPGAGRGAVVVEVADRGPGITTDDRPHVFTKFFRGRGAGSGTGLGLAICRGIVEAHGGTIEADARPGGGVVFRIRLPLTDTPPQTQPEAQPEPPTDVTPQAPTGAQRESPAERPSLDAPASGSGRAGREDA